MTAQLQIIVRDTMHSDSLESRIRSRLAGLERICPRITHFRVTIGTDHHHLHGERFSLKLDVRLPGLEIVVTRDHREDLYLALREACQAARRRLREHMERGQDAGQPRRAAALSAAPDEAADRE